MMISARASSFSYTVATAIVVAAAVPANAQTRADQHEYNLPAQDLGVSLRTVAAVSGRNVLAAADLLNGKVAPSLRGRFNAEEAVSILLAGSGLQARIVGSDIIIERKDKALTQSELQPDRSEIVVTGSRIRGAPVASPVISIGQEEMRNAGQSSLGEVVRSIPQSFGGGQNPGVGTNVPSGSGVNVGGASSINLRGIGSDATLTLLNGHRLSYSASRQSIDVSSIPLGAVDRLEIVPDGASALYGSDAVAGVANIILKRDFDGVETSARLGAATDGGDFEQRYGLVAGQRWSSGGLIATYEFAHVTPIYGRDRSYAEQRSPALTLLPGSKSHSAALSGHQEILPGLTFELDGLYNKRWSTVSYANNSAGNISLSGMRTAFESESFVVAPTFRFSPGHDWRLFATGSYGRDLTHFVVTTITGGKATASPRICYCNSAVAAEIGGDGSLFSVPAGAVKLALGAGYRSNHFSRFNGPGNLQNISPTQDSYYAYGELNLPLIGPEQEVAFVHRLEASAALRYENYPGVGEIATPKLGLIYAPTSDFDIKGSWGKSFRAPTLLQQYQARSVILAAPAILGGAGYPAGSTVLFVQGGNPDLKPERATTWSATLDLHPRAVPGAKLEISYFEIAYRDRIVTPIAFINQSLSNPIYRDRLTDNPNAALLAEIVASTNDFSNIAGTPYDPAKVAVLVDDTNINAGRQSIHGVDALFSYRTALGGQGQSLTATLDASYLESEQQISSTQPVLPLSGTIFNPPHFRSRGGLSWDSRHWALTGYVNYTGGVRDARFTPSARLHAMTTLDLSARFRPYGAGVLAGLDLSVSLLNAFNAKPKAFATTLFSQTPYDSTNYSPVGRFVAFGIRKKW
jgi:outer membrane receptor protein involved in Fe transport